MNNWEYANQIPTSPWRSPMTLAREIPFRSPTETCGWSSNPQATGLPLPPRAVLSLRDDRPRRRAGLDGAAGTVQRIDVAFAPGSAEEFGLILRGDGVREPVRHPPRRRFPHR